MIKGIASMLLGAGCFLIMEYMIGIEGIRFLLLWHLIREEERLSLKKHLQKLLKKWIPYLSILASFLFWRIFIFESARSVTDVGAIGQLYLSNPAYMVPRLIIETIKDFFETVVLAWFVPFYRYTADLKNVDLIISFFVACVGVLLFALYWRFIVGFNADDDHKDHQGNGWTAGMFWIGILAVFTTIVPVILANRDVRFEDTFDRYTLAGSIGVSLIIISVLYKYFDRSKRVWITGFLIVISMITHYQNAVFFKNFWEYINVRSNV